jgi:hypothetical protein
VGSSSSIDWLAGCWRYMVIWYDTDISLTRDRQNPRDWVVLIDETGPMTKAGKYTTEGDEEVVSRMA